MDNFEIDLCVQPCPRVPGRVGGEEQQQRVPALRIPGVAHRTLPHPCNKIVIEQHYVPVLRTPGGAHRTLPHPCNKIVIEKTNILIEERKFLLKGLM